MAYFLYFFTNIGSKPLEFVFQIFFKSICLFSIFCFSQKMLKYRNIYQLRTSKEQGNCCQNSLDITIIFIMMFLRINKIKD